MKKKFAHDLRKCLECKQWIGYLTVGDRCKSCSRKRKRIRYNKYQKEYYHKKLKTEIQDARKTGNLHVGGTQPA